MKKYSLGEVTGNQCVLNKMYDDMFAQKGSYAFYIQWLNNEFPSEVEYQKKLQETKGLKKILVMATKPNHLATIEQFWEVVSHGNDFCRMSGLWSCVDASARDRWNEPNQNVHRVQKSLSCD